MQKVGNGFKIGNDFCFENFKILEIMLNAKLGNNKCLFIPWLFEDFCRKKEIGTTVKYFLEKKDDIMKWKSETSQMEINFAIFQKRLIEAMKLDQAMTGEEIIEATNEAIDVLVKHGLQEEVDKLNDFRYKEWISDKDFKEEPINLKCEDSDVFKYVFLLEICKYLQTIFPKNPMNLMFADDLENILNIVEFCFLKNIKELPDNIQIDLVQTCVNETTFKPISKLINSQPIRKDYFIDSTDLSDINESKWFKYLKLKSSINVDRTLKNEILSEPSRDLSNGSMFSSSSSSTSTIINSSIGKSSTSFTNHRLF